MFFLNSRTKILSLGMTAENQSSPFLQSFYLPTYLPVPTYQTRLLLIKISIIFLQKQSQRQKWTPDNGHLIFCFSFKIFCFVTRESSQSFLSVTWKDSVVHFLQWVGNSQALLQTRTQGGRMEGAYKSTELWRHPNKSAYLSAYVPTKQESNNHDTL